MYAIDLPVGNVHGLLLHRMQPVTFDTLIDAHEFAKRLYVRYVVVEYTPNMPIVWEDDIK